MDFFSWIIKSVRFIPLIFFMVAVTSCAAHRSISEREEQVDTVISTARSFVGTPYKYGGTTRAGMDCSGLLLNSFRAINLTLPRSSEDQSKVGEAVKIKDLQPGDLVFFATGKKRKRISHVGLVTERKGKADIRFIHASSNVGVVETNLFSDYYIKRFRIARRVIPAETR